MGKFQEGLIKEVLVEVVELVLLELELLEEPVGAAELVMEALCAMGVVPLLQEEEED